MTESQLLISRLEDLIWDSEKGKDTYLGFLNECETSLCCSYLKNRGVGFTIYGGYPEAARVYLSVNTDVEPSDFPISAILVESKGTRDLTHRDFLGSLMGLGIKRECIGDILLSTSNSAVVFIRKEILSHVIRDLDKVGRDSVVVSEYRKDVSELSIKSETIRLVVSSMRVDNIVSSLANCSRAKALELISDDKVFCNYLQVRKASFNVSEGDVLSVRGFGKFIIGDTIGNTRRDNLIINVLHYI